MARAVAAANGVVMVNNEVLSPTGDRNRPADVAERPGRPQFTVINGGGPCLSLADRASLISMVGPATAFSLSHSLRAAIMSR